MLCFDLNRILTCFPYRHLHWVLVSRQRARYMVSLVLPVTVVTLGIGMCEGVGE